MNKAERRKAMPLVTDFVDDMRKSFGEPAGIHAEENGTRINWGEPMTEGYAVSPVLEPKKRITK
tara:strand:- start:1312 stop:1503 length:192 start_codon:yes stop_codon:yes gene_type:complete